MRNNQPKNYFVSRQKYYYSGESVVEVESNGLDYAGSDMLVKKYRGEGQSYASPIEAVEVAIEICRQWRIDGEHLAHVGVGSTGGMGFEIEPTTFKQARLWAKEAFEELPKCDRCGDILPKEYYTLYDIDNDEKYCGEYCADKAYEFYSEAENELETE